MYISSSYLSISGEYYVAATRPDRFILVFRIPLLFTFSIINYTIDFLLTFSPTWVMSVFSFLLSKDLPNKASYQCAPFLICFVSADDRACIMLENPLKLVYLFVKLYYHYYLLTCVSYNCFRLV